jgi:hypothetical protein
MDETKEWKYIKERTDLLAEIKTLKEKSDRYEEALKIILKQTRDIDTWDFADRALKGKYDNVLPYRINED